MYWRMGEAMKRSTHVLFGVSLSIFILNPQPSSLIYLIAMSIMGSYLPDVDLRIKHRMMLHNLFVPILFSIMLYFILDYISLYDPLLLVVAFDIGFTSHILLDMFTYAGVSLFYPFSKKRYRIARLRSDSPLANVFFSAIALILIFLWAYHNKLINTKPFGL